MTIRTDFGLPLLVVFIGTSHASDFPIHVNKSSETNDHYCGLYCVYQVGKMSGKSIPLDSLIRPDRLRGQFGSSLADLHATCTEFELKHRWIASASYADLLILSRPAIVLIKASPEARVASHWVLLLEMRLDSARVYDPSTGVLDVSAAELQSLWGGPAIVFIEDDIETIPWHAVKILIAIGFVLALCTILKLAVRYRVPPLVSLIGLPCLIAFAWQLADPSSFLHNPSVVHQMASMMDRRDVERMTPSDLLRDPGEVTVVDVRMIDQFRRERIRGAIHVPVNASFWKNRQRLAAIPDGRPLVLYCNSASCGWAETMAKSSLFQRFTSVRVLDDGLSGYLAAAGPTERGAGAE